MAKKMIKLTEGDLHRIIKESVKKVLKEHSYPHKEFAIYNGNDMNYENVKDSAITYLLNAEKRGKIISSVKELIENLYYSQTFNESDYEIVYDACEDALIEFYNNN